MKQNILVILLCLNLLASSMLFLRVKEIDSVVFSHQMDGHPNRVEAKTVANKEKITTLELRIDKVITDFSNNKQ